MLYLETRFRDRGQQQKFAPGQCDRCPCVLRLRLPWKTSVASKGVSVDKKTCPVLCNSILQRCGRRLDSNLSRIVWVDCTLALEPEAKDRMLHPDLSVSGGEILLFLGAGYNPFFSPPSAMLCVTNKSAFLFRHMHPLETSFFIFCRWCLLTGQGQCCQLFSHVIFQLSLVPWLCTSKITRVTRLLMEHSSCVSTLRVMGG